MSAFDVADKFLNRESTRQPVKRSAVTCGGQVEARPSSPQVSADSLAQARRAVAAWHRLKLLQFDLNVDKVASQIEAIRRWQDQWKTGSCSIL